MTTDGLRGLSACGSCANETRFLTRELPLRTLLRRGASPLCGGGLAELSEGDGGALEGDGGTLDSAPGDSTPCPAASAVAGLGPPAPLILRTLPQWTGEVVTFPDCFGDTTGDSAACTSCCGDTRAGRTPMLRIRWLRGLGQAVGDTTGDSGFSTATLRLRSLRGGAPVGGMSCDSPGTAGGGGEAGLGAQATPGLVGLGWAVERVGLAFRMLHLRV